MSHFVAFVIGGNIDKQLAPYSEFECTGDDNEYVQDVDVTDEVKEHGLSWHGLEDSTITDLSQLDVADMHKYGYALVDAEGNVLKAVNRTNPNAKWDWYQLGGRWSGFLKAKPGCVGVRGNPGLMGSQASAKAGTYDTLRKGDIDLAGMRKEAADAAAVRWDKAHAARGGQDWITWNQMHEVIHKGDIDAARTAYHEQPALKQLKQHEDFEYAWEVDDLLQPRETFIKNAHDSAVSPFAIVMDGKWHERGKMGWFACVADEQDQNTWNAEVTKLIDSLPDDAVISVVDCHI